ncbi:MAG: hypothetical protein K0S47_4079 [Herbinix sp.]|nr:hypothetical protein [Herbinix sp.]
MVSVRIVFIKSVHNDCDAVIFITSSTMKVKEDNMKLQNKKRIISFLLCFCFIASFFLNQEYIIDHANHLCTGEHCSTCQQLQNAENILKQVGLSVISSCIGLLLFCQEKQLRVQKPIYITADTPVHKKIRLNR